MSILKIQGIPPLDGEYDFEDAPTFTNRELHLIKKESGVRAGELEDAFKAGDNDLLVALAMIVLARHGKGDPALFRDMLWDATTGQITFEFSNVADEGDALPPKNAPDDNTDANKTAKPSGASSPAGSAPPGNGLSRTGIPV